MKLDLRLPTQTVEAQPVGAAPDHRAIPSRRHSAFRNPQSAILIVALLALLATGRPASATPYEVVYDANTPGVFPEDVGWQRFITGGGATRTIEDGLFKLDGFASNTITDQYLWDAMETLNAGPGEMFYVEWRMRLLPGSDSDVGVFIATDNMQRAFSLAYTDHSIFNSRDNQRLDLDTTEWHTYRIESLDMIDYAMSVDGALAWEGFFDFPTTRTSEVRWGDQFVGSVSSSHWDYFKFGVTTVPEPQSAFLLITGCLIALRWGRRVTRIALAYAFLLMLGTHSALATPYEVIYDANVDGVFPEDVGWQRFTSQGGAHRTVENGIFTLMAQNPNPNGGFDRYHWDAMEMLNAGPGEMFYAEWRMRLLPGSDSADTGVFIATDGMQRDFNLQIAVNGVGSTGDNRVAFIDTTVFRTYRLESFDMVDYAFFIDGELAWEGYFDFPTGRSSQVRFGDFLDASASASQWDYFRFGVAAIPEPGPAYVLIAGAIASVRWRKSRSQASYKEDPTCLESQQFWWAPWSCCRSLSTASKSCRRPGDLSKGRTGTMMGTARSQSSRCIPTRRTSSGPM